MPTDIESEALTASRIDEEDIRLTTGFADIFTAIVLVVGAGALNGVAGPFGSLLTIAAGFALGKPIVERRQFATSSYVLAVSVAICAIVLTSKLLGVGALLIAAGVSAAYWRCFRVPMALAITWIGLCLFAALTIGRVFGVHADLHRALSPGASAGIVGLLAGLAIFALAMRYDARDRLRSSRMSDVAFWLHFAAAPMIVHSLFAAQNANPFSGQSTAPGLVLAIFLLLTLVSVVIDRRPLLISSFGYLLVATGTLLATFGDERRVAARIETAMLAPAVVGLVMLLLAAGWTPLRNRIVPRLPEAIRDLVPPPSRSMPAPERPEALPAAETESTRLVLGFNDIFVAAGATTLFFGALALAYTVTKPALRDAGRTGADFLFTAAPWIWIGLPALSLWAVAEYFVRRRRMAWPAVTTALLFSLTGWAAGLLLGWAWLATSADTALALVGQGHGERSRETAQVLRSALPLGCFIAVAFNLLFWWRHRTPISFALAVAALLPLAFGDVIVAWYGRSGDAPDATLRLLGAGLAIFILAMAWDRSDTERTSQRADVAFWLHLLASLITIPALFWLIPKTGAGGVASSLAAFAALIALALAIDRRAPLVVALPFVLSAGAIGGSGIAALAIAVGLLALVLRWDQLRGGLLGLVNRA